MEKSRGFTLIELLVVIAIISLLSSIILVSLSAVRERGRITGGQKFNASMFNVLGAGVEGYWDFNEGSGTVYGEVTKQHDGTAMGSPLPTWSTDTPTSQGTSVSFSPGGYIVTSGKVSTPSPRVTISAWVKTTNNVGTQVIFSVRGGGFIFFGLNAGKLYVYINGSSQPSMVSSGTVGDGKWHHVAWTSDGAKSVMYIDGRLDSTLMRTSFSVPSVTAYIARDVEVTGYSFNGLIDEVAMYGETMLAADIRNMYFASLQGRE